ncbi:MAG TPA: hypothetical protein VGH43_14905 [Jatrophihabitans sp.]|jgi:hypothetical protein
MAKDKPLDDKLDAERDEDGQIYVDRDKIDFDPDDGLLSGTAIDGTSEIPGSGDDQEPAADNTDQDEHDKDS